VLAWRTEAFPSSYLRIICFKLWAIPSRVSSMLFVNILLDLLSRVANVHSKKKSCGSGRWTGLACDFISSDVFYISAVETHGDNIRSLYVIWDLGFLHRYSWRLGFVPKVWMIALHSFSVFINPKGVYCCLMDYFTLPMDSLRSVESSLSFSRCRTILDDQNGIIWEGTFRLSDESLDDVMFCKLRAKFQSRFNVWK
jgi:hypothetical protein